MGQPYCVLRSKLRMSERALSGAFFVVDSWDLN